jgi:hypothetical protein
VNDWREGGFEGASEVTRRLFGWVAYRTRKERKLPLLSDPHTYERSGTHQVLVKVIDIFGNDTSQAFAVEAK